MNESLKKTNRRSSVDSQKKYMERHTILCVTLDNSADAEIIGWLNGQEPKQKSNAVRSALKKHIEALYARI